MPKFLTTKATASSIEEIIRGAKKDLYLISPYLKLSVSFLERLMDADANGIAIHVVYGKKELKVGEMEKLQKFGNLHLYYCENLHAKCYFNEKDMVISSMNMYEFSEANNREMGISFSQGADVEPFNDARNECMSILRHAIAVNGQLKTQIPVAGPVDLDYRNWKDKLYAQLKKELKGQLDFYDNGENLAIKSADHNLQCSIEQVKGKNLLMVSKILSGKLFNFLKTSTIEKRLPKDSRFELIEGSGKHYDMAFWTLTNPLKSNRMNYLYPQDVDVVYHAIHSYILAIDGFVKQFERR